jgi:hypothetical protein
MLGNITFRHSTTKSKKLSAKTMCPGRAGGASHMWAADTCCPTKEKTYSVQMDGQQSI